MSPPGWDRHQAVLRRWVDLPDTVRAASEAAARAAEQQDQAAEVLRRERVKREAEATEAVQSARRHAVAEAARVGLAPKVRKPLHPRLVGLPPTGLEPVARELEDAVRRGATAVRDARGMELRLAGVLACVGLMVAIAVALALDHLW